LTSGLLSVWATLLKVTGAAVIAPEVAFDRN
jgi:hypothetical protein